MNPSNHPNAVLVINTASRHGRDCFVHAKARLEASGLKLREAHAVRRPARIPSVVRNAIGRGAKLVILGGGDGSVTSVAGAFAHTGVVLGLLPTGTGNSFARGLGLPLDIDGALDTIVTGKVATVDLASVNGLYFANAASIGLSTAVGRNTPGLLKRLTGPLAYVIQGLRETVASHAFRFEMTADDGRVYTDATQQIVVTNGPIFGTTPILPDATLVDGRLAVYTVRGASRAEVAKMWLGMLLGGFHTRLDSALYFHSRTLRIATTPRRTVDIDGEIRIKTPASFRVEPQALRVLVPGDSSVAPA